MNATRRFVALTAALLAVGGMLFAAGDQEPAAETTETGALQVEFWHSWAPEGVQGTVLQNLMNEFNEANDGEIYVIPIFMGERRNEKIAASLAAGDPPDIAWISGAGQQYYEADQLISMDKVYGEYIDRDDIIESMLIDQQYLGTDITLPFENSNLGLLYDKQKLTEAGIEHPGSDLGDGWTWDEFINAAAQFSDPENGTYGWEPRVNGAVLSLIFWQLGGEWVSDDLRTNLIVSDEEMRSKMIEALELIDRMLWEDRITSNDVGDQGFGNFDMAFEITGPWDIARNLEPFGGNYPVDRLGVAPVPVIPGSQPISYWYQKALALFSTNDRQEDAALQFVSWFYSPEIHARWSSEAGYLPVTYSASEHPIWRETVETYPQFQVFADMAEIMRDLPQGLPLGDRGGMLDAVRFQELTPEAAVARYVEDAQIQLDDFWARQDD
jgi:ABC-type glycerol-3-phosphate transport system substrate-binding protein